ncbi:6476_t:CDS:2 [Acaulospora morrowiae]|uniref:6476_t:CDS:1 n=1 Tax=Acaulospora morrowiae TaxID=94023 RepID=A0A9N9CS27_9GLOM|nr:6476_t:CDS:2 [Acaulospora morrowiae]
MTQRSVPRLIESVKLHNATGDGYKTYTLITTFEDFIPSPETSSYIIFRFKDEYKKSQKSEKSGIIWGYIYGKCLDFMDRMNNAISVESTNKNMNHFDDKNLNPSVFEDTGYISERSFDSLNSILREYVICRIDGNNILTLVRYIKEEVLNSLKKRELVRKYICRYCKKLYKHPCNLRDHEQVHSNKRLKCRIKGCKKSYTLKGNRGRHEKSHASILQI